MNSSDSVPASGRKRPLALLALRFVLFCLPLALVGGALEIGMRRVLNSYSLKRDALQSLEGEVDTLIFGSSPDYYGVCPAELSGSAFNMANVSQSLYYDDRLLTQLAPRLPKLKRVLLGLNYLTLSYQMHNSFAPSRQYYYEHAWGIPPAEEKDAWDPRRWSLVALYPPSTSLRAACAGFRTNLVPELDGRGWFRVPASAESEDLSARGAARAVARHEIEMSRENEEANAAHLERFLAQCRERRLETILFTPPALPAYADAMNAETWNRAQAVYSRLAVQYGARYVSFLREPGFGPGDFKDPAHLNAGGAIRFSRILNNALHTGSPPENNR